MQRRGDDRVTNPDGHFDATGRRTSSGRETRRRASATSRSDGLPGMRRKPARNQAHHRQHQ
jgi:hypothetical protein